MPDLRVKLSQYKYPDSNGKNKKVKNQRASLKRAFSTLTNSHVTELDVDTKHFGNGAKPEGKLHDKVKNKNITPGVATEFHAFITSCRTLETLDLSNAEFTQQEVEAINSALSQRATPLRTLIHSPNTYKNLDDKSLVNDPLAGVETVIYSPAQTKTIKHNNGRKKMATQLQKLAGQASAIKIIQFENTNKSWGDVLFDASNQALSEFTALFADNETPNLRCVDLSDCELSLDALSSVVNALANRTTPIQRLILRGNCFDNDATPPENAAQFQAAANTVVYCLDEQGNDPIAQQIAEQNQTTLLNNGDVQSTTTDGTDDDTTDEEIEEAFANQIGAAGIGKPPRYQQTRTTSRRSTLSTGGRLSTTTRNLASAAGRTNSIATHASDGRRSQISQSVNSDDDRSTVASRQSTQANPATADDHMPIRLPGLAASSVKTGSVVTQDDQSLVDDMRPPTRRSRWPAGKGMGYLGLVCVAIFFGMLLMNPGSWLVSVLYGLVFGLLLAGNLRLSHNASFTPNQQVHRVAWIFDFILLALGLSFVPLPALYIFLAPVAIGLISLTLLHVKPSIGQKIPSVTGLLFNAVFDYLLAPVARFIGSKLGHLFPNTNKVDPTAPGTYPVDQLDTLASDEQHQSEEGTRVETEQPEQEKGTDDAYVDDAASQNTDDNTVGQSRTPTVVDDNDDHTQPTTPPLHQSPEPTTSPVPN